MIDPITGTIIGSAISGLFGASSAKSAARQQAIAAQQQAAAQLQAAREANELTAGMYRQGLAIQQPYIRAGQTALGALLGGMNLGQPGMPQPQTMAPTGRMTIGGQGEPMLTTMPVGGAQELPPGMMGGMPMQGGAGGMYVDATGQMVDSQGNVVRQPLLTPQQMGATPEEMAAAGQQYQGRFAETFKPSDIYQDPSYQFRLQEGLRALKAAGAATGTLQTGQGLKDITNYAQQAASQEYQSAYDRFRQQQESLYNRLAGIAGIGQTVGGQAAAGGQQAAGTIGGNIIGGAQRASDLITGGAAAGAAGTMGAAQAIGGGIQGGIQNWMGLQLLRGMQGGGLGYRPTPGLPQGYQTPGAYVGGGYGTGGGYGEGPFGQ